MNRTKIELPPALATAVRTTAAYAPPHAPDLGAVRARARVIRRRRTALRSAAAAVVVVAIAASAPTLRARLLPIRPITGGPVGSPIGLWLNRDLPPVTQGVPPGNHVAGSGGEITAQLRTVAGKTAVVPVGRQPGLADGGYLGPAPLPGGGLATIGYAAAAGNGVGERRVVVVDANGRTTASRPFPENGTGEPRSMPMTGSATTLFWWSFLVGRETTRPVLDTYDIAGGKLRILTPAVGGNGYELPYFGMQATSTRLISWPAVGGSTCSADIADTATGERVTVLQPAIPRCTDVYFALSPDGKRAAALVTYRDATTWSQRVITIDVGTGKIQQKFDTPDLAAGTDRTELVTGIDWANDDTLRYARGTLTGSDPILLTYRL